MSTDRKTIPQKLPFWHTVGEAYRLWAKNLPELVRISWLWLVVMLPVLGGMIGVGFLSLAYRHFFVPGRAAR